MVVRVAVALTGAAFGVATLILVVRGPDYTAAATAAGGSALLVIAGWSPMLGAVMLSTARRGIALLLYFAGVAWFAAEWAVPRSPAPLFAIGLVGYSVAPVAVAHAASAFGGPTRGSRLLAGAGYLITLGIQGLGTALWFGPDPATCGCPGNPLAIADDPALTTALTGIGVSAGLAWALCMCILFAARLATATSARLRHSGAVTVCGLLFSALTAMHHWRALDGGSIRSDAADPGIWIAQSIVLTALGACIIAEVIRIRQSRRALARVVTGLAQGGANLREDLARRLGDPGLVITFPVDGGARYVDAVGAPVEVAATAATEVTEVSRDGLEIARILHRPGLSAARIGALVSAIDVAIEHERLDAEAFAQLADLRASGERIVAAGDAARTQLERDLHDGAQQQLVSLMIRGNLLRTRHPDDPDVARAVAALGAAADQLRSTARRITSVVLTSSGLAAALEALAETRALDVSTVPARRLSAVRETTIYLLAERLSRAGTLHMEIFDDASGARVELRCDDVPDLGDLADRITTLGGVVTRQGRADGTSEITVRWPKGPGAGP